MATWRTFWKMWAVIDGDRSFRVLDRAALAASSAVANCDMNRIRQLAGAIHPMTLAGCSMNISRGAETARRARSASTPQR